MFTIAALAGRQAIPSGETEATYAGSIDVDVCLPEGVAAATSITVASTGRGRINLLDSLGHKLLEVAPYAEVQVISTGDEFDPWRTDEATDVGALRNNADSADNLIITDAGAVTLRNLGGGQALTLAGLTDWISGVLYSPPGSGSSQLHAPLSVMGVGFGPTVGFYVAAGVVQSGGVAQWGVGINSKCGSDATTDFIGLSIGQATTAASYTTTNYAGIRVRAVSKGANHIITTNAALVIDALSVGATNNYGILIGNVSGTGAFAIKTGTGPVSFGDVLLTIASATGTAGFRLPHGAAPSAPVDGDVWTTTAGLFARINGVTKTILFV
jgi:hypothetical protein